MVGNSDSNGVRLLVMVASARSWPDRASGMVEVTMNGQGKLQTLKINPQAVDPEDVEALEDLLLVAIKDAQDKADALQQQETQRSMGFLGGLM